ncbi:MAG: MBL fold metallo-hydrolase [Gammaproteobacteria bacterium]|nr:MAG: MBL fold metallo-hydrolase [Gammaproteobacteria bacterium]
MITNQESGTRIDEIAQDLFRISTPVTAIPGGFTFNQFLVQDDEPLLFHTGLRGLFPLVSEAIRSIMPLERLCHISFSHYEADECGALNDFLKAAPNASPLCGQVGAMVSIGDIADRPPRALDDGEVVSLGSHNVRWHATPHLPHGWDCGFLMEETTGTLLCGDLFTQGGAKHEPLTGNDILEPSEAFRGNMDYFSNTRNARSMIERLAASNPTTLACMHGASWQGDGAAMLRALGDCLCATYSEAA